MTSHEMLQEETSTIHVGGLGFQVPAGECIFCGMHVERGFENDHVGCERPASLDDEMAAIDRLFRDERMTRTVRT